MSIYELVILLNIMIGCYLTGSVFIYYDKNTKDNILKKTTNGTLIDKYSYYRHKYTNPALFNIVGMLLLFGSIIFVIIILTNDLNNILNPILSVLLLLISLLMQNLVIIYFITAIKKIKIGKKEKLIFAKETAIMFGVVPEYMFCIGLAISYALHFIFILKILFN
jgi:hypothetical protein